jgi:hypothetical protein
MRRAWLDHRLGFSWHTQNNPNPRTGRSSPADLSRAINSAFGFDLRERQLCSRSATPLNRSKYPSVSPTARRNREHDGTDKSCSLSRFRDTTFPSNSSDKTGASTASIASPLVTQCGLSPVGHLLKILCMKKRPSRSNSTTSPSRTCSKDWVRMVSTSPGQRVGNMLWPRAASRRLPVLRNTSAARLCLCGSRDWRPGCMGREETTNSCAGACTGIALPLCHMTRPSFRTLSRTGTRVSDKVFWRLTVHPLRASLRPKKDGSSVSWESPRVLASYWHHPHPQPGCRECTTDAHTFLTVMGARSARHPVPQIRRESPKINKKTASPRAWPGAKSRKKPAN